MANPKSYSVGVDLGGTNIKIVVVSNEGELLEYVTCDTADAEGRGPKQSSKTSTGFNTIVRRRLAM